MQARAHLRLIVSVPPTSVCEEALPERLSMVQPVSSWRLRAQWLRHHRGALALWSASVVLLSLVVGLVIAH